ncbi:MAG: membrane protein insertion efficiency factor YidD [Bacteroidetes bacterium]|nr:membrane protein insertion efficiency factor YidD [Bacteroidota bacterium]
MISPGRILSFILTVPVYIYQWFISPLKGPGCRHVPTCSSYAIEALRRHGPWHGLLLGTGRILRCRPGGTHGFDPVPRIIVKRYRFPAGLRGRRERCNRLKDHMSE